MSFENEALRVVTYKDAGMHLVTHKQKARKPALDQDYASILQDLEDRENFLRAADLEATQDPAFLLNIIANFSAGVGISINPVHWIDFGRQMKTFFAQGSNIKIHLPMGNIDAATKAAMGAGVNGQTAENMDYKSMSFDQIRLELWKKLLLAVSRERAKLENPQLTQEWPWLNKAVEELNTKK